MNLEGCITRLRALEPEDVEMMYAWENDPKIWGVSGTLAPFSRHTLTRFIDEQQFDIFQTRQQRLVIDDLDGKTVGMLDLFEFDPQNLRAGIGIMIHDDRRNKGYAADALEVVCRYSREVLRLHQLWCSIGVDNGASLALFLGAGFAEVGVKRDWQATAEGFSDEVLMQKIL